MNIVATIEARMRSSRLPGKILKPILGMPLLGRMIERIRDSRRIDRVVVATTDHPLDDSTEAFCRETKVSYFRGSEQDVLHRVLMAAKLHPRSGIPKMGFNILPGSREDRMRASIVATIFIWLGFSQSLDLFQKRFNSVSILLMHQPGININKRLILWYKIDSYSRLCCNVLTTAA